MRQRPSFILLAGALAATLGCDGSSGNNGTGAQGDAGPGGPGTRTDGGVFIPGTGGSGLIGSPGGTGGTVVALPPPALNPLTKVVIPGPGTLVGSGPDSCSNAPGATTDRWCAFFRPGKQLGISELWVFNASAATLGAAIRCDGTDPNCVRMTANLWTEAPSGGPSHPTTHRFNGDTLIFHADAVSQPNELYKGPIYAWQPGWAKPQAISTGKGITCVATSRGAYAACIDNLTPPEATVPQFDLLAGPLVPGDTAPLPKVDRIIPQDENDQSRWSFGFSRNGDIFAWSNAASTTTPPVLYTVPTAETKTAASSRKVVATNVADFVISADSTKIVYLANFNFDPMNPQGILTVDNFPAGGAPVPFVKDDAGKDIPVGAFSLFAWLDNGIEKTGASVFTGVVDSHADFTLYKDITAPVKVPVVDHIVSAVVSPDLRYTFFSRDFSDTTGLSDAWVAKNDGTRATCPLQRTKTTSLFGSAFTANSNLVFWTDNLNSELGVGEGWVAKVDCTAPVRYTRDVDFWFPIGERGLVYSDTTSAFVSTLKNVPFTEGVTGLGTTPVKIQDQVHRIYTLLPPDRGWAVYSLETADPTLNGIYLYKLDFGASAGDGGVTPPASGDAGARD